MRLLHIYDESKIQSHATLVEKLIRELLRARMILAFSYVHYYYSYAGMKNTYKKSFEFDQTRFENTIEDISKELLKPHFYFTATKSNIEYLLSLVGTKLGEFSESITTIPPDPLPKVMTQRKTSFEIYGNSFISESDDDYGIFWSMMQHDASSSFGEVRPWYLGNSSGY